MKYTDNDLKNIIALCEQDEDDSKIAKGLSIDVGKLWHIEIYLSDSQKQM